MRSRAYHQLLQASCWISFYLQQKPMGPGSLQKRLGMVFIGVALLLPCASSSAKGENPNDIAKETISQFKDWMKAHRIKRGAIAVSYNGKLVATGGRKRDAADAAPVASLSKAITAVCTAKALEQTKQTAEITLDAAMPTLLSEITIVDDRLRTVTIAQLVSHNSGIHSRYHSKQLPKLKNFSKEQKRWQLAQIASEKLVTDPGSGYHYNNANYLLLGLVIEQLTGQSYTDYCQTAVLKPLGISTAMLHKPWRVMSAFGGWKISAIDYAKFLDAYFPANTVMGKDPYETGMLVKMGGGAYYNLGMLMRASDNGFNFWHVGSWRWKGNGRNDRFGAYAAAYDNGFTVVANYAHDAFKEGEWKKLDTALYRATHP